jgi:hypothetical protein
MASTFGSMPAADLRQRAHRCGRVGIAVHADQPGAGAHRADRFGQRGQQRDDALRRLRQIDHDTALVGHLDRMGCGAEGHPCAGMQARRAASGHAGSFKVSGRPAAISVTRSQAAATAWLSWPSASTKARTSRPNGITPRPISLPTSTTGPRASRSAAPGGDAAASPASAGAPCAAASSQVGEPQREAVDHHQRAGRAARRRCPASASGSSTVRRPGTRAARSARWRAMRSCISASCGLRGGDQHGVGAGVGCQPGGRGSRRGATCRSSGRRG